MIDVVGQLDPQVPELLAAQSFHASCEDIQVDVKVPGDACEDGFLGAFAGKEDLQHGPPGAHP